MILQGVVGGEFKSYFFRTIPFLHFTSLLPLLSLIAFFAFLRAVSHGAWPNK